MIKLQTLVVVAALLGSTLAAKKDDRWVWTKQSDDNHRSHPLQNNVSAKYEGAADERSARARAREPTTRRPQPGQQPNDEIDDYPDEEGNRNIGTRNYPYPPYNNGPIFGTNSYPPIGPGISGTAVGGNGILVGPGGPTGIIGRPPHQKYPGEFPFNGFVGQPGLGYPTQAGAFGAENAIGGVGQFGQVGGGGYIGAEANLNTGFGGQFGGAGIQYPPIGSYPIAGQFGANGQYTGGFPPSGAQYPGGQFQSIQFPIGENANNRPLYTEGYGLAYNNGGYPGFGQYPVASHFDPFATRLNDYENTNRSLHDEGKRAATVESGKLTDQRVNDKINKSYTKVSN